MSSWAKGRVLFGGAAGGLAVLALVGACSGSAPHSEEAGSAGAKSEAGAAGKGSSGNSNQSGSSSQDGGQSSGGKGGSSGGGTNSGGVGGGIGSPCHSTSDCPIVQGFPGPLYCSPPGAAQGCGACPGLIPPAMNWCNTDAECRADGGTKICEHPCGGICPMGSCVPGCTAETVCPIGMACGATGRCQASACSMSADCPPDFDCLNSGCVRRSCESDAECDGYCVTGACYSALGACVQPAA
jgi:hypothetical protein